jgi:hypothetical protein
MTSAVWQVKHTPRDFRAGRGSRLPAGGVAVTILGNLVLLCHRHHWMVHEVRFQLVRVDDGTILTIPPPRADVA